MAGPGSGAVAVLQQRPTKSAAARGGSMTIAPPPGKRLELVAPSWHRAVREPAARVQGCGRRGRRSRRRPFPVSLPVRAATPGPPWRGALASAAPAGRKPPPAVCNRIARPPSRSRAVGGLACGDWPRPLPSPSPCCNRSARFSRRAADGPLPRPRGARGGAAARSADDLQMMQTVEALRCRAADRRLVSAGNPPLARA